MLVNLTICYISKLDSKRLCKRSSMGYSHCDLAPLAETAVWQVRLSEVHRQIVPDSVQLHWRLCRLNWPASDWQAAQKSLPSAVFLGERRWRRSSRQSGHAPSYLTAASSPTLFITVEKFHKSIKIWISQSIFETQYSIDNPAAHNWLGLASENLINPRLLDCTIKALIFAPSVLAWDFTITTQFISLFKKPFYKWCHIGGISDHVDQVEPH